MPAVRFAIVLVVTGQDTHTIGMIQLKAGGWEESWEMGGAKGLGVLSAEERPRWGWRGLALGPNSLWVQKPTMPGFLSQSQVQIFSRCQSHTPNFSTKTMVISWACSRLGEPLKTGLVYWDMPGVRPASLHTQLLMLLPKV